MERRHRIPPILQKTVFTLVSGGVTYLLSNLSAQTAVWNLTLSVFVGGAVLLVQFMIDFDHRLTAVQNQLADHTVEMKALVDRGFAKVNEATELFGLVEESAVRTDVVTQLVRNATGLDTETPVIVHGFAQSEISRLALLMKDLQAGEAAYDGEDHDWLLTLTQNAAVSIDATSTSVDADFWTAELGLRYLAGQRDAVRRGVKIRRIFILDDADARDAPELQRVCRAQSDIGVEVRVAIAPMLPATARLDPMLDFIVFDHAVSYEVTPALPVEQAGSPVIASTRLVLRHDRVARRVHRFNDLWELGEVPQTVP